MSEVDKVAIIGAGNLGSRHLQALALTQRSMEVTVIDPSMKSLKIAQTRWEQMEDNPRVKSCKFYQEMEQLPLDLDVVIVATSSGPRRMVIEELLGRSKVRFLVLEKVLFQTFKDYCEVGKILREKTLPTWVNCSRRTTGFYKRLAKMLCGEKNISMSVSGGNWGLGCNSIHMLDTYAFLSDQKDFHMIPSHLDDGYVDSKRKGYIEFTGTIQVESPKGILLLSSYRDSKRPVVITIDTEHYHFDINEAQQIAKVFVLKDGLWEGDTWEMDSRPQSRQSHEIVQELMERGSCDLPFYDESARLHQVLLEGFLDHLSNGKKERCKVCQIT